MSTTEGIVPFIVPDAGKDCETWYKVVGDLKSDITPLVIVHGGPGLTHDYLKTLGDFWHRKGIPVILYDQIGNGRSTHLPEKKGDESFWVEPLFWAELENLVEKLGFTEGEKGWDMLGHSWGGMVGATFAGRRPSPKGLRKLILGNAPATMKGWVDAYVGYRRAMPKDVQERLDDCERNGGYETKEYEDALMPFMSKHCCTVPYPEEFVYSFEQAGKDSTVTLTMSGPSEFEVVGNLRNWSAVEAAKLISVPTLVINGVDEGASDEAIRPFLEEIKNVKYVKFEKSSHMPCYEEKDKYFNVVGDWLLEK